MFPKTLKTYLCGLTLPLACSPAFAVEETLHFDLYVFTDFIYAFEEFDAQEYIEDRDGFTFDDTDDFLDEYPIFEGKGDSEVYGFGSFEYDFFTWEVAPSFNLSEKYDWEIWIDGLWGYEALTPLDLFEDFNFFSEEFYFDDVSVEDVTTTTFAGLTPNELVAEILALVAPIPSSGTLDQFLDALLGMPLPDLEGIDPSSIDYYSDFAMPYGYADIALNEPFDSQDNPFSSLVYAAAGLELDIHVSATRRAVPDSGSTGMIGFAILGSLLLVRRRMRK